MIKIVAVVGLVFTMALCQQYDYYHVLHLPHSPPLHPVFAVAPRTQFTCDGRPRGYYADVQSGCQAYHFCWRQHLVSTDLCANGTLFNEQFQVSMFFEHNINPVIKNCLIRYSRVCDHFYNVRCGSPYEDL